jgi:MFS family permease
MRSVRISIVAVLVSVFGALTGNGVLTTLVPVRSALEGFARIDIGFMGAAYFSGMLAGAVLAPRLVQRFGWIPVHAAALCLSIASMLTMPLVVAPWSWILLRGVTGFSLAGIYAVVEGYLQASAENRWRGRLLAAYSVMQYTGWATGGQLMRAGEPEAPFIFHVGAAVILFVGILPLAFAERDPPGAPRMAPGARPPPLLHGLAEVYRISPVGFVAVVLIGTANGAFWTLTPVYGTDIGLSAVGAGTLMTLVTLGAAVLQFPVGRLSDAVDRRIVLAGLALSTALLELVLGLAGHALAGTPLLFLGPLLGGLVATQYYTASAHTNDRAGPARAMTVSATLLFLYSVGAIAGPVTASLAMQTFGPGALHLHNAVLHGSIVAFVVYRMIARGPAERSPAPPVAPP